MARIASTRLFRAWALLVVVLSGFGAASLLHEIVPHPGDEGHAPDALRPCALCVASNHAWGDLTPASPAGQKGLLPAPEAVLSPETTTHASPEARPSPPRSPPLAA